MLEHQLVVHAAQVYASLNPRLTEGHLPLLNLNVGNYVVAVTEEHLPEICLTAVMEIQQGTPLQLIELLTRATNQLRDGSYLGELFLPKEGRGQAFFEALAEGFRRGGIGDAERAAQAFCKIYKDFKEVEFDSVVRCLQSLCRYGEIREGTPIHLTPLLYNPPARVMWMEIATQLQNGGTVSSADFEAVVERARRDVPPRPFVDELANL